MLNTEKYRSIVESQLKCLESSNDILLTKQITKNIIIDYHDSDDKYDYYKNYRIAHLNWITGKDLLDFRDNVFRKNNPNFDYDEDFVNFILDTSPIRCDVYDGNIIIADFQTLLALAMKEWIWLLYTKVLVLKNSFNAENTPIIVTLLIYILDKQGCIVNRNSRYINDIAKELSSDLNLKCVYTYLLRLLHE